MARSPLEPRLERAVAVWQPIKAVLVLESFVGMAAHQGLPGLAVQRLSDLRLHSLRLRESLAVQIFALGVAKANLEAAHEQGPEHVVGILAGQLLKQLEGLAKLCFAR